MTFSAARNPLPFFKDKTVLVTGNTGFKGSWLTLLLLRAGARVIGYALAPHTKPSLYHLLGLESQITQYTDDIRNQGALKQLMEREQPEIVFHLAAQPLVRQSYLDPISTFEINALGTAYLLQAIADTTSVRAAVIATTDKVYENLENGRRYSESDRLGGKDPYSASKACAEMITRSYVESFLKSGACRVATARAGNVIGGGDWSPYRLIPDIVRAVYETHTPVILRYPHAIRPWQHVLDPLMGYLMLARSLYEGKKVEGAWNFALHSRDDLTVEQLVQTALKTLQSPISYAVEASQNSEAAILQLDASKALQTLGWSPHLGLNETILWTMEWYRHFYQTGDPRACTRDQLDRYDDFLNLSAAELMQ